MPTSDLSESRLAVPMAAALPLDLHDRFLRLLLCLLVGYACFGKGFAYLGFPPFFVGESVLLIGLIVLMRTKCLLATTASLPSLVMFALMSMVAARALYDFPRYHFDALRDSVVALYGLFALILAALIIEKPRRIGEMIGFYRWFAAVYVIVPPLAMAFGSSFGSKLPGWPGSNFPLVTLRAGELAIHLAGVAIFTLLGFRRAGWLWSMMLVIGVAIVFALNRGGMLAFAIPVAVAVLFSGSWRHVRRWTLVAALFGTVALVAHVKVNVEGARDIDVAQLAANMTSIIGGSKRGNLGDTKEWRLDWWKTIIGYTIDGNLFWTGRGFGPNLALTDGFGGARRNGVAPLRSPHSVHMTFLARTGVPGLCLWLALLAVWFATMFRNALVAWRRDPLWGRFFVFVACYALAALVDASFDVAIEGPMVGIWFWSLIGIGLGSSMVYWSKYPRRSALRLSPAGLLPAAFLAILLAGAMPGARAQAAEPPMRSISNPDGSCLSIKDRNNVVIENMHIGPCGKYGIDIFNSHHVVVRNVTIEHTGLSGILVLQSSDVTIKHNTISDTISGVSVGDSQRLTVSCNHFRNPRGPIPRGQFVQFGDVHGGGNSISCNIGVNEPGKGQPEDAISIYRSSGIPGDPIKIERNRITGGGPSLSGGGIMLGDSGGSYLLARDNILQDPGQYGIGVAGEHDIAVIGNIVVARQKPFTNVGISVWRQQPPACQNITVADNLVHWISKSGRPNPWWKGPHYCGLIKGLITNNFNASPGVIEQRESEIHCGCGGDAQK